MQPTCSTTRNSHHGRPLVLFVGAQRRVLVSDLAATFKVWEFTHQPRLVCLESPAGWGKTRLVQELYAHLARSQRYWPPSLMATGGERAPDADRDRVDPGTFSVEGVVRVPWLWSGVTSQPGVSQHVLSHVARLDAHLRPLTLMAERNRAVVFAAGSVVGFAVGTQFGDVSTAISGAGTLLSINRAVQKTQQSIGARRSRTVTPEAGEGSAVDGLIACLRRADRAGLPVVLVIDDAHDADESVPAFLEKVLLGTMPVRLLCVCAARSDRLAADEALQGSFGEWLVSAIGRFPDRVTLVPLARLDDADLERLVDERAPRTAPATTAALASSPTASDYRAATPTKPGRHAAHSPRAFWKAASSKKRATSTSASTRSCTESKARTIPTPSRAAATWDHASSPPPAVGDEGLLDHHRAR